MEIDGDWAPIMTCVLEKIRTRFFDEDKEEEHKGSVKKTYW
jgi:hypothetical protein